MECAIGKINAAAVTPQGAQPAAPDHGNFRADLLDLVYTRVNRCDPRRTSIKYARLEDHSTLLMGRITEMADPEAGRMLDRLDGIQAVLVGMAMEWAYRMGMAEGMRAGMEAIGVNQVRRPPGRPVHRR